MENKKILVICPSRSRPLLCQRMIASFKANSSVSDLCIEIDSDDPYLKEYKDILQGTMYSIKDRKTTTQRINSIWGECKNDYKFFCVTNDDFIFRTPEWDKKFLIEFASHNNQGIMFGNDLLAGANMPTCSVISADIVNAVGWLQMPRLTHLFGDNVWQQIGRKANCLYYRDNVIIEHCHVFGNKNTPDATHQYTNSKEMYQKDERAFLDWMSEDSKEDIRKVKECL